MTRALRVLCLLLALTPLVGCARAPEAAEPTTAPEKTELSVAASFYPIYALAANIADGVPDLRLTCLTQPQDGCLRSYVLSDWDAALLASCDAVLIGGRGLESFESALEQQEDGFAVATLMDGLTLLGEGEVTTEESSHWDGENPWLYLSVSGAKSICSSVYGAMTEFDPRYEALYEANFDEYTLRLDALLSDMRALVPEGAHVIVAHEGLLYFADQLGLTVSMELRREPGAWFSGDELTDALESVKNCASRVALVEAQAPQLLLRDLEAAGVTVVCLDTLTTGTRDDPLTAYEDAMRENARRLGEALRAQTTQTVQ